MVLQFRHQIIQDLLATYFLVPIRIIKKDAFSSNVEHLKNIFKLDNEEDIITEIDNILNTSKKFEQQETILNKLNILENDLKLLSQNIYYTQASNQTHIYRLLKRNIYFWALSILAAIYIAKKLSSTISEKFNILMDFNINAFLYEDKIVIIGPLCNNNTEIRKYKKYFKLNTNNYELSTLYRFRTVTKEYKYDYAIKHLYSIYINKINNLVTFHTDMSKPDIKKIIIFIIALEELQKKEKLYYILLKNGIFCNQFIKISYVLPLGLSKLNIESYEMKIKRHRQYQVTESFNSFGDKLYKKLLNNKHTLNYSIIKALRRLVNSDGVILYNYIHNEKKLDIFGTDGFNEDELNEINSTVSKININSQSSMQPSATLQLINNFYQDKELNLKIDNIDNNDMIQPFKNKTVKSLLSIPLIFDNKIRGVLHFISYFKEAFDEDDLNYLMMFSDILSFMLVETNYMNKQESIMKIIDSYKPSLVQESNNLNNICQYISDIFASDGAAIWFNVKSFFDSYKERSTYNLVSEIGLGIKDKSYFSVRREGENSIFLLEENTVAIENIEDINDINNNLKFKNDLIKLQVKSLLVQKLTTKNRDTGEEKILGAIVIFDKSTRMYEDLSFKMMRSLSNALLILNQISNEAFEKQQMAFLSLHEGRQFLNRITRKVELITYERLESNKIKFYDDYNRINTFKGLKDIRYNAQQALEFLMMLHGKDGSINIKDHDIINKDIKAIENHIDTKNKDFVDLKDLVTEILISAEVDLNQKGVKYIHNTTIQFNTKYTKEKLYQLKDTKSLDVSIPSIQLNKVVQNILDNAIKYSLTNSRIRIEYIRYIYYTSLRIVTEKAPRIKEEEEVELQEKGYRGYYVEISKVREWSSKSTENIGKNMGQGLYIANLLSRAWGGSIELRENRKISHAISQCTFDIDIPNILFIPRRKK